MLPKLLLVESLLLGSRIARARGTPKTNRTTNHTSLYSPVLHVLVPDVPFAQEMVALFFPHRSPSPHVGAEPHNEIKWKTVTMPMDQLLHSSRGALVATRPKYPLSGAALTALRRAVLHKAAIAAGRTGLSGVGYFPSFRNARGGRHPMNPMNPVCPMCPPENTPPDPPESERRNERGYTEDVSSPSGSVALLLDRNDRGELRQESPGSAAGRFPRTAQQRVLGNANAVLSLMRRVLRPQLTEVVPLRAAALPFTAQLALFRRARLVVGVEGAGLTNLL